MAKTMLIRVPVSVYKEVCKIASEKGVTMTEGLVSLIEGKDSAIREKDKEITTFKRQLAKKPKTITRTKVVKEKITQFDLGKCSKCSGSLSWDLNNSKDVRLLEQAINNAQYIHAKCGD